jgi:hypothetical protein
MTFKRYEKYTGEKIRSTGQDLHCVGRTMAQAVSCRLLTAEPGFDSRPVHMGFVVDKVRLWKVFLRVVWF